MLTNITLGSGSGDAAATVEIQLRRARTEFAVLREEIGNALTGAPVQRVYDNAAKALPGCEAIPKLVNTSLEDGASLRSAYAEARTKYEIRDARIETLMKLSEAQNRALDQAGRTGPKGADVSPKAEGARPPSTITFPCSV